MMVSEAVKLQKVVMFQQMMIKLYRGESMRLPRRPDLFMKQSDIPIDCTVSEKLLYYYFMENKTIRISLESYLNRNLSEFDLMALSIYSKYFPLSQELIELIESHEEILNDERWYE